MSDCVVFKSKNYMHEHFRKIALENLKQKFPIQCTAQNKVFLKQLRKCKWIFTNYKLTAGHTYSAILSYLQ